MTATLLRNKNAEIGKISKPPYKRSIFDINYTNSLTMNASYLTPILCENVIPGQTLFINTSIFARLSTQLVCPMDNLQVETFFFYCPWRLVWDNFPYFIGAVKDPNAEIQPTYLIPQIEIPAEKNTAGSLFNYLSSSRLNKKVKVNSLPFRIHNLIQNEYFRDPDCESPVKVNTSDADDNIEDFDLYRIHKSRDYFTNSTRDIQQGMPVNIPLGMTAPVIGNGTAMGITDGSLNYALSGETIDYVQTLNVCLAGDETKFGQRVGTASANGSLPKKLIGVTEDAKNSGLIALLNQADGATMQSLSNAIMMTEFLQALNRGGTKYVDVMRNIYNVIIPDLTIQRPMYLGGTSKPLYTSPVVQTSGSGISGSETPQGNISGYGVFGDGGRVITLSAQEFGTIIGYMVVKAQPQYQQGLDRQWTIKDKYDLFNPFFNNAPDQSIKMQEIYQYDYDEMQEDGVTPKNDKVFGYIGRYDEHRYKKNRITGEFNSEYKYPLDIWHYAEKFEDEPANNADFMKDKTYEILDRTLALKYEDEENTIKSPQLLVNIQYKGANIAPIPTHAINKLSSFM